MRENRRRDEERRYRVVFTTSLAAAAGLHAAFFLLNPAFEVDVRSPEVVHLRLDIRAWAPDIINPESDSLTDPELKIAIHRVPGPGDLIKSWPPAYRAYAVGGSASVRARVDRAGQVTDASVLESSGDLLKDQAFEELAFAFRYRIEPIEQAGPMEIIQRMRIDQIPAPMRVRMRSEPDA